jgi:hypothetical protein
MSRLAGETSHLFLVSRRTGRRYVFTGIWLMLGAFACLMGGGVLAGFLSSGTLFLVGFVLFVVLFAIGASTQAVGGRMLGGQWGLHVGDEELTVMKGKQRIPVRWADLDHGAIRPWHSARELHVRFRPEVLAPAGLARTRPATVGRPATDMTVLFQIQMLGDREDEFVTKLQEHLRLEKE